MFYLLVSYDESVKGKTIEPNGTQNFTITVKWDEESTTTAKAINFTAKLDYKQSTTNFDETENTVAP